MSTGFCGCASRRTSTADTLQRYGRCRSSQSDCFVLKIVIALFLRTDNYLLRVLKAPPVRHDCRVCVALWATCVGCGGVLFVFVTFTFVTVLIFTLSFILNFRFYLARLVHFLLKESNLWISPGCIVVRAEAMLLLQESWTPPVFLGFFIQAFE